MLAEGACTRPDGHPCCGYRCGDGRDCRNFAVIEPWSRGARLRRPHVLSLPLTRFRRNMAGVAIEPPRHPLCQW